MDTLTHALSGALLARATAPRQAPPGSLPRRVAAGFLAGASPDLDGVAGLFGPGALPETPPGLARLAGRAPAGGAAGRLSARATPAAPPRVARALPRHRDGA